LSASSFDMRPARRYRPGPVTSAVALTILVSAFFSADPLLDAVTGEAIELARLTRPLAYLLGAPLFGVWDSLSLLTASQHYAVVSSLVALYVLTRLRARRTGHSLVTRVAREIGRAFGALLLLLGFYAGGLLLPRPMVGLELNDPDLVSIDFHSHTAHSHDALLRSVESRLARGGRIRRRLRDRPLYLGRGR
jgi:hypothetical protein